MKFATTTALGLALAIGAVTITSGTPAQAKKKDEAAASGPQFSSAFRQAAQPLQKAIQAGDFAAAKTALPAAQAAATTDDDKYQSAIMALTIAQKTNDTAAMGPAVDAAIASNKAPPEVMTQLLDMKGRNAYNANDLAGADAAFTKLVQLQPTNGDTAILLAQVKLREGRPAEALPIVDQAIQAKRSANQPVPEDWLRRALSIAYDSKPPIAAGVVRYGQQLITAYPSTETWRTVIQTYRDTNHLDPQTDLDAMRLARATHSLAGEREYYDYANTALNRGFPGEAQAVITEGVSSNMVENKSVATSKALAEVKAVAGPKVAADKASLPTLEKTARAAADGKKALNTADAYYGYSQFAPAADLYKVAIQKGGIDANVANLRLGMALAQSGQKAASDQALSTVTGPNAALAGYWKIYNAQQGQSIPLKATTPAAG